MSIKLGILNEFLGLEKNYIKACQDLNIEYEVIDVISNNWIENIMNSDCDGYLVRPSAAKEVWKNLYDERLYFISQIMNKQIYPSYNEIMLYENKKNMAYWLKYNNISHPNTWIFYDKKEAMSFIKNYSNFPIVFKTNIGSAAIGVKFFSKRKAIKTISKIFTKFMFFNRGYTKWYKTKYLISFPLMDDKQFNYVIFQEKIDIKFEWRVIKIGDSYFGHQKLINGKYHSGSGLVGWVRPPDDLLNFAKSICDVGEFSSMNIDIFESVNGQYFVNELQTIFGSYLPSQMYIENIPGRLKWEKEKWSFEEGLFNQNGSCNLRVNDFVNKLISNKKKDT